MPTVREDHPRQQLLFIAFDGDERLLEGVLEEVSAARAWTLGPPELVDLEDEEHAAGILKLYSAQPPWGELLPEEVDRAQLDEATLLVERLTRFSAEQGVELEFELDGETVGSIDRGVVSRDLAEGLLGEWRRTLEGRARAKRS